MAWSHVVGVMQSLLGVLIVLPLLPVVTLVLLLLWVWRNLVLLLVWAEYGRVARVASGMEALFALDSPGARAVISGVAVLRGTVSVDAVNKVLAERLVEARDTKGRLLHPKFRQVVERRWGVVVWMWEENFAVESHVHQLRGDRNQPTLLQDEEDVLRAMSRRANQPFVRGQAKWEVLVAPLRRFRVAKEKKEEEEDYTAVMVRLHHALGDGRSMVGLIITALVDPPLLNPPQLSPTPKRSYRILRTFKFLWALTHLPWVVARVLLRGDDSVLHGKRLGGEKFLAWSPPMSLGAIKDARTSAGATVNDILLTALAGALHKYFRMEGVTVPNQVMTVIPIDVTDPGTPLSLANRISLCTVPLATGEMTPLKRLQKIHHRINVLKRSPDIMVNYFALDLISNLLPAPLARRALHTHGVTLVSSNMPGPKEQINLFGKPVDDIMFFIPNKSRTGLGVSMLSYCGVIRCGLTVDSSLIPNVDFAQELMDKMATEVEIILGEISGENSESVSRHIEAEESDDATSEAQDHPPKYVSTDEYSDLHESSRRFFDLEASEMSCLENEESENHRLLGGVGDFQNERLEIRTVVRSESNLSRYCVEKEARFAMSEMNLKGPEVFTQGR